MAHGHALGTLGWRPLAAALIAVSAAGARPAAAADQLVAFDEVYTQLERGNVPGETFHHGIVPKATEPASWVSPVNYSRGTAYLYLEVLEKPSKRNTLLTVCFDGPKEGYGCFDSKPYTDVGAYETRITMGGPGWFQYNQIAWNQRRDDYHLVIKDPALGGTQGGRPASDYVPTRLRVVLTIVPPDGTYVPPMPSSPADGGAGPADAGARSDAATPTPTPPGPAPADAAPMPSGAGGAPALPPDAAPVAPPPSAPGPGGAGGGGGSGAGGAGGSTANAAGGTVAGGFCSVGAVGGAGRGPGTWLLALLALAVLVLRGRRPRRGSPGSVVTFSPPRPFTINPSPRTRSPRI